jgi:HAD superfamily hydrolase (TIGR01549 family)
MTDSQTWRQPRAVIFDLDGTLTKPHFDFDRIRREIGLPTEPRTPVLEALEEMTADQRVRAEGILLRHEQQAAEESELWEDAHDVLADIRSRQLPIGLLTRNSRKSVDAVLAKHALSFDCAYTRDDGPAKPSPEPVLEVCRQLGVKAGDTWVVGDYLFDLQSGNRAGALTILMAGDKPLPDFADQADHTIRQLSELIPLIDNTSRGPA